MATERDIARYARQLHSPYYWTRRQAVDRLAATGDSRAVPPLLDALDRDPYFCGDRICDALVKLDDPSAIDPLLERLRAPWREVRTAAARALGHFRDPRIEPVLVERLGDRSMMVRAAALQALGEYRNPAHFDAFLQLLQERDHNIRAMAVQALGRLRDTRAVEPLLARLPLEKKYYEVRTAIYQALGEIGDPRAYDMLIGRINEPSPNVRAAVFEALAALGDDRAVLPVLELYRYDPRRLPQAARQALERMGVESLLAALQAVLNGYGDTELRALVADDCSDGILAERVMLKWLTRQNVRCRSTACRMLGHLRDTSAVKPLAACLNDPVDAVRAAACTALGLVGDTTVAPKVATRAGEASPVVRAAAIAALDGLGAGTLAVALREMYSGNPAALAELLLAGEHPVSRPLVELLARTGFDVPLQVALRALFGRIWAAQADDAPRMLCRPCLLRPTPREFRRLLLPTVKVLACRGCGNVLHFKRDIAEVVAVLDTDATKAVTVRKGSARVNALKQTAPFDYDHVEILAASDFDVERFCMSAGNDTDRHRAARRRTIPVTVECKLSENTLRVLDHIFGHVVRAE